MHHGNYGRGRYPDCGARRAHTSPRSSPRSSFTRALAFRYRIPTVNRVRQPPATDPSLAAPQTPALRALKGGTAHIPPWSQLGAWRGDRLSPHHQTSLMGPRAPGWVRRQPHAHSCIGGIWLSFCTWRFLTYCKHMSHFKERFMSGAKRSIALHGSLAPG